MKKSMSALAVLIAVSSDLGKHLGYLLLPVGAVIGLMAWRRKK